MSTHVTSDDAGNLTSAVYFDGTDAGTTTMAATFTNPDSDENLASAEAGAMGVVNPVDGVTGAQHMPNAAQPGSMTI